MGHGSLWLFNMDMCCSMQISSLRAKLEECKRLGKTNCVISPNYPAASNEDYLFDCMNLYARLEENGQVVVEGIVFYWNPVDGDSQKSAVIHTFKDLDECLTWISYESTASDECVKILNEKC